MYANPVLLPQFSNREDFLLTLSLFDDDTGSAVNLTGTILAGIVSFTGANWIVTDGAIVTASTTPITIPYFPVGNQLSALPLTVGLNLTILAGDPITIADPTGKNTMIGYVTSYSPATGALVCQIGLTFQFEIRSMRPHRYGDDGYGGYTTSGNIGVVDDCGPILSASLGNGITIIDNGYVQVLIPESQTRRLRGKTYLASMTATDSVNTRQLFIGKLPEQYGGVTI